MNLQGVRILDLSRVLAGPFCTSLLVDQGADVVKVEAPHGDDARHLGPFLGDESIYFAHLNRGKRSIVLDLKNTDDRSIFFDLVEVADVVVENFRPGVTERLGINYDELSKVNSELIYASISGFGQSGQLSHLPAYDLIVQAMSGIMASTGPSGGMPTRVGESLGDVLGGLFASWAITSALFARHKGSGGQHIDVSMLDALIAVQVTAMSLLTATGSLPGRIGNRHPVSTPFDTFETSDGQVAIAVANDVIFQRFSKMIGVPWLVEDDRFADDATRTVNEVALKQLITDWTKQLTTDEILELANESGVPAGPIWDFSQALEHSRSVGNSHKMSVPTVGEVEYLRQPVRFVGAKTAVQSRNDDRLLTSPVLGGDLAKVRQQWLGYPSDS